MTAKHAAEVGVRLVLDSNAKSEADKIKAGLHQIEGGADHAAAGWKSKLGGGMKAMGSLAATGLSMAAGAAVAAGAAFLGMGAQAAHAYLESEEQVRELAGTLTMIDQKGNAFEDLLEYADDTKNELEELAMQAGITDDAMVGMFNDIVERGGKGVDAAKALAEQMSYAGRAIKGGPEALASGFELLQMGMVKAKNPLVQLIASTGTLKGSAKSVAKEMSKMSIDDQMALAEKAIGKMSEKMKAAPMTIGQMATSMKVGIGNLFEEAGAPIVAHLSPIVEKVKALFFDNQGPLQGAAQKFGEGMGKALDILSPIIDELYKAVVGSWGDIEAAIQAAYGPAKEAFEYIYENKEAFAKTIGDAAKVLISAASWVIRAIAFVRDSVFGIFKAIAKSGIMGGDIAKGIGDEEQTGQAKDLRKAIFAKGGLSNADTDKRRADYVKSSIDSGNMNPAEAGQQFDKAYRRAMDDHLAIMAQVEGARDAALEDNAKGFAKAFNVASKNNDEAAMKYVAEFLKGNASLANALAKEGPGIFEGGMGKLLDSLKGLGPEGAETAGLLKGKMKPDLGIAPKGNIVQNFNGAINVKQEFRDQDPDRVAVVFKRALEKAGTNRLQSRYASPFGF